MISTISQKSRNVGYFRCIEDVTGYDVEEVSGAWTAKPLKNISALKGSVLMDLGGIVKVSGQILRKVKPIENHDSNTFYIVLPGGDSRTLDSAPVARLG